MSKTNLQILAEAVITKITNDYDNMCCITGREGIGKSSLAYWLCKLVDPDFDVETQVVYRLKELNKKIFNTKKYGAVLIDEGMEVFYKRDWNNPARKRVLKTLTMARQRNLFYVFCVPRFTDLDELLRNWRVRIWIKMIGRGKGYVYTFDDAEDYGDPWHLWDANLKWSRNYWKRVGCKPIPPEDYKRYFETKKQAFKDIGEGETDDRDILIGKLLKYSKTLGNLSLRKMGDDLDLNKNFISRKIKRYDQYELRDTFSS